MLSSSTIPDAGLQNAAPASASFASLHAPASTSINSFSSALSQASSAQSAAKSGGSNHSENPGHRFSSSGPIFSHTTNGSASASSAPPNPAADVAPPNPAAYAAPPNLAAYAAPPTVPSATPETKFAPGSFSVPAQMETNSAASAPELLSPGAAGSTGSSAPGPGVVAGSSQPAIPWEPSLWTNVQALTNSADGGGANTSSRVPVSGEPASGEASGGKSAAPLTPPNAVAGYGVDSASKISAAEQLLQPNPPVSITQAPAPNPITSREAAAPATTNFSDPSTQDLKKTESINREHLLQQITSRLQSALNEPAISIVPGAPSSETGGGKSAGQNSNQAGAQASSQESAKQAANATSALAASPSNGTADSAGKNSNSDSAAIKASALPPALVDQSLHAMVEASALPANAAAASSPAHPSSADAPISSRPLPLPDALPASLGDVVKASELYQRVGGAEMHISMDTELLGSIDLRAVMHQSTLTATIGVQRADVQSLLANELPALQHALAEQSLHVEHLSVMDSSLGARMDTSGHSQQYQNPSDHSAPVPFAGSFGAEQESQPVSGEPSGWSCDPGHLSVRV